MFAMYHTVVHAAGT